MVELWLFRIKLLTFNKKFFEKWVTFILVLFGEMNFG